MKIVPVHKIFTIQNEDGSIVGFFKTLEIAEKRMRQEERLKKYNDEVLEK